MIWEHYKNTKGFYNPSFEHPLLLANGSTWYQTKYAISLPLCVPMRPLGPPFLEYLGIPLEHDGQFRQFLQYLKAMSQSCCGDCW